MELSSLCNAEASPMEVSIAIATSTAFEYFGLAFDSNRFRSAYFRVHRPVYLVVLRSDSRHHYSVSHAPRKTKCLLLHLCSSSIITKKQTHKKFYPHSLYPVNNVTIGQCFIYKFALTRGTRLNSEFCLTIVLFLWLSFMFCFNKKLTVPAYLLV